VAAERRVDPFEEVATDHLDVAARGEPRDAGSSVSDAREVVSGEVDGGDVPVGGDDADGRDLDGEAARDRPVPVQASTTVRGPGPRARAAAIA
jgi:hypothetical protein